MEMDSEARAGGTADGRRGVWMGQRGRVGAADKEWGSRGGGLSRTEPWRCPPLALALPSALAARLRAPGLPASQPFPDPGALSAAEHSSGSSLPG